PVLIVALLGLTPSHPQHTGACCFPDVHETGRGAAATACIPMADDVLRCGLRPLGVQEGGVTSLGALLPAGATAQQAELVVPIDLAHRAMGLARATQQRACR